MKTEIIVRVVDCHIFRWENEKPVFLLLKRSKNQIYPDAWQCVTGKIEKNETPNDAAIRELKEETGLTPISMWIVDQVNHFFEVKSNRMNLIPVFGVQVDSTNITLSVEHNDYKWCSVDEGIDLIMWNQQKQGLFNFHHMLTKEPQKLKLSAIFNKK